MRQVRKSILSAIMIALMIMNTGALASAAEVLEADELIVYEEDAMDGIVDTTPPELTSLTIDRTSVDAPGEIEVIAGAKDDVSGVSYLQVYFKNFEYNKEININLYSTYYNEKHEKVPFEDGKFHGTLTIDKYGRPGEYKLNDVFIYDTANNSKYYRRYNDTLPEFASALAFTVSNPNTDTHAPELTSLTIDRTSVDAPGEIEVIAGATDDLSGVSYLQVYFKNFEYNKEININLYSTYYNEKHEKVPFEDGKFHGTLTIDQYGRPGEYKLNDVFIYDTANNSKYYRRYNDTLPDYAANLSFIVNNDGKGVALTASIDTPNVADQIKAQDNDAVIQLDYSNNSLLNKSTFDAIKGTNKELILESSGVQWVFKGNDINQETKDIKLNVSVNYINNASDSKEISEMLAENQHAVVLNFPENGTLPGKAKIRIKADYSMKYYLGKKHVYVYYFDKQNKKMVPVAANITITPDSYIEFEIDHCSKYVMTRWEAGETVGPAEDAEIRAFVTRMYDIVLEREPEAGGLDYWTDKLSNRTINGADYAIGVLMSDEYRNKNDADEVFVDKLYRTFLDRNADEAGRNNWVTQLKQGYSRKKILAGFVNSNEFTKICERYGIERGTLTLSAEESERSDANLYIDVEQVKAYVTRLYSNILGRDPDEAGFNDWVNKIRNRETNAATVAKIGFFESQEYRNMNKSNEGFVTDCYKALMGRDPDAGGLADWVGRLDRGEMSRAEVIEHGFGHSQEFSGILRGYGLKMAE